MIKGKFDGIFSLGDLCLASIQLKKLGLRPYSGVFDWMATPKLSDITAMLSKRFDGFLARSNLRIIGYAGEHFMCVSDDVNGFVSNHDFAVPQNNMVQLSTYDEVLAKYKRRIGRFLNALETNKRTLFVRTEGTFKEALALEEQLKKMVKHDFHVLLILHEPVAAPVKKPWPLKHVTAVAMPDADKWNGNDHHWAELLKDVTLQKGG